MNAQCCSFLKRLATGLPGLLLLGATMAFPALQPAEESPPPEIKVAQQGLDLLMNGDPDAAIQAFQKIETDKPESPLGYLLEANATWWKIYLTTGNLIDPDVFNVSSGSASPYDAHFEALVETAIKKAKTNIDRKQDVARSYLYEGMAYALRARLAGMRWQNLPAARAGKKMRSLLLTATEADKNLRDAYLGLGLYDYFVDTLPAIVKLFRWIVGLPGGSRAQGLKWMEYAAKYGELTSGEAQFYLAKDYSRTSEKQPAKSLDLFKNLQREYPRNQLWKLMTGSLEIRMGQAKQGEALYREVLEGTREGKSAIEQAFHRAAKQALERRHPGRKFE